MNWQQFVYVINASYSDSFRAIPYFDKDLLCHFALVLLHLHVNYIMRYIKKAQFVRTPLFSQLLWLFEP